MLYDIHCHLDWENLKNDLDGVIDRAKKAGLKSVITSGINPDSNTWVLDVSKKYDILNCSWGWYPFDADDPPRADDLDAELNFLKKHKDDYIAIGEVGCDLHYGKDIERQKKEFAQILAVAKELDKPVIVHSRKAEAECLDVIEASGHDKVILHCFTAKKSLIKRGIEIGCYFSVPPAITRVQSFKIIVELCDVSKLLLETDSPFMGPKAGEKNEPYNVTETVPEIAKLKGMDVVEVRNVLWMNYDRLFR